jgi:O-antigen/teichoic acid export membrane protein
MKKLTRNIFVAIITKLLLIISGVVAQRFILYSFGSDINGLTSSVTQFLSYFTLLEAGLGLASIQALYKPLADNDDNQISRILSATSIQYRKIGIIFLGLTVLLSILMPVITHSDLEPALIFGITMLMGLSNVLNYFFIGRYQALLNADRKVYIIHTLDAVLGIAFSVIRILLINWGYSIIVVQIAALFSPIVRILVLRIYVRRYYKNISYKAKPDNSAIGKRKYVLVHQIVGMVTNHTDVTILTILSTLSQVSVYSVYNLIYGNISALISTTFSTAAQASFGRLVGKNDPRLHEYYDMYESLFTTAIFGFLTVVLALTVPFVHLYTRGVEGVNYEDKVLAALFMISILFSTVRIPAIIMVNAAGTFKETQRGAVIEAIINIVISIPAFLMIGMRGLLIGTCVAMAYRAIDIQIFTYREIFHIGMKNWIILIIENSALMVGCLLLFKYVSPISISGWGSWVLAGVVFSFIACLIFGTFYCIAYHDRLKMIKALIKH